MPTIYEQIYEDDKYDYDGAVGNSERPESTYWRRMLAVLPWLLLILTLVPRIREMLSGSDSTDPSGTYETGFDTDMKPVVPHIKLRKIKWYGGVQLDPNGTYYLTKNGATAQYVGRPVDQNVDEAWDALLDGRFVGFTEEEVQRMGISAAPEDYNDGLFYAAPSSFHTLHCLNYIRKALDSEFYPELSEAVEKPWTFGHRMHLDHCIEMLRQSVMCSLDMTLVPRPWVEVGKFWHADPDQLHTCRDFEQVRHWLKQKHSEQTVR